MRCISYKSGYKYQLEKEYVVQTPISAGKSIATDYIELNGEGLLSIKKGYAWNGPSGPAIDTLNFMRGSLVHDALYQLMRNEELDREQYRKSADELLRKMCRKDGMSRIRAWCAYFGLRIFGEKAAHHKSKKKTHNAPKPCG
jgi:hypothetical protein